jgi:hypothetical protein
MASQFSREMLLDMDKYLNISKSVIMKSAMDETWNDYILYLETPDGVWASYLENADGMLPYLIKYAHKDYTDLKLPGIKQMITDAKSPSPKFGNDKISYIYVNSQLRFTMLSYIDKSYFHETRDMYRVALLADKLTSKIMTQETKTD